MGRAMVRSRDHEADEHDSGHHRWRDAGNGAASDDRWNGFERGGWARGAGDDETRTFITQTYQRAQAFLFGWRTYEFFAASWDQSTRCAHIPSAWP